MSAAKLSPETIAAIKGAPFDETQQSIADRLGLSRPTVRKYRREVRDERQEAAREIIAEHVREHIPDALADLTDLRRLARTAYETNADAKDGALWLNAIKTTLDHVKPDDSALDAAIEAELAQLAEQPQAGVSRQAPAAQQQQALH